MQSGAKIYYKDNLTSLGPTVERELLETKIRDEHRKIEEANQQLASIVEYSSDAITSETLDGTILSWNKGAEKIYGYAASEMIGKNITRLSAPDIQNDTFNILNTIHEGKTISNYNTVRIRKDGKQIDVSLTVSPLRNNTHEIIGASAIARDVTDEKIMARGVLLSNDIMKLFWEVSSKNDYLDKALKLIFEWSKCKCAGIRIVNPENKTIPYAAHRGFSNDFINQESHLSLEQDQCACIRVILGTLEPQDHLAKTPAGSFYLHHSSDFASKLSEDQLGRFRGACINNGFQTVVIVPIRHQHSTLGALHLADPSISAISLKEIESLESVSTLIGQGLYRFEIEEKMRRVEEELRALSRRLVQVQENERRTIARELHDEIGQSLTALKMLISQSARLNINYENLNEAKNVVGDLMQQVREMSLNLRPSMLDDLGLLPTLLWHVERFSNQTGIRINFEHEGLQTSGSDLPQEINTTAYRVIQEALTNIARYAEVDTADVKVQFNNDVLTILIHDQGKGFAPKGLNAKSPQV
jgi:PAS domain S-box-containing protein